MGKISLRDFLKRAPGEEKKVEYIELIYDLIFVYMIGRNSSLASHVSGGFIEPRAFLWYAICTLVTIQIWYLTTLYINRYGDNSFQDFIGLFINMYLLYYMGDSTRLAGGSYFYQYNIAWALILLNVMLQYLMRRKHVSAEAPWESANIMFFVRMLSAMIIIIAAGTILYRSTGIILTPLAVLAGVIFTITGRSRLDLVAVDFPHLTERVMLYVVFTFGEMIVVIAAYFSGEFTLMRVYYSTCGFLIVVGLFMSYGFFYDRLLDREMSISGNLYMLLHIFIIFALSCLTMALEFMTEEEIDLVPKTIYLVASFVVYYLFIFALMPFTKGYRRGGGSVKPYLISLAVFVALMALTYNRAAISILISVIMTFWIWYLEYRYWKHTVLCPEM